MADVDSKAARAAYMRSYNRERGAEPVKGEQFTCLVCHLTLPKTGKQQKWCASCKAEGTRRYKAEKRAAEGTIPVGASQKCRHCESSFTKVHKRQLYCQPCSELSAKSALPGPRRVQLEYQKRRNREKRALDPSFAIRERISAQVNLALRGKKAGRSWETLVGYRLADLMAHLERQFLPGMTWANRADWHIDHIVPLTSFKFTEANDPEVARAWALSNLRPLWAADNIRKSGSRTHLI